MEPAACAVAVGRVFVDYMVPTISYAIPPCDGARQLERARRCSLLGLGNSRVWEEETRRGRRANGSDFVLEVSSDEEEEGLREAYVGSLLCFVLLPLPLRLWFLLVDHLLHSPFGGDKIVRSMWKLNTAIWTHGTSICI